MNEVVYLNGSLMPASRAGVSAFDFGFLYGFGLFETMPAYGGRPFLLTRHLRRLQLAANIMGIALNTAKLKKPLMDVLKANGLKDARIRITISGGQGTPQDPTTCQKPTVLITASPLTPPPEKVYREGFKAIISPIRRHSSSPICQMKTTSYLDNMLARREARKVKAHEAIFLNERDMVAEASMSNIFIVSNGRLVTPGAASGRLPGITMEVLLEIAPHMGIEAVEADFGLDELMVADEAFLTNSIMGVMPLTEVDWKPIGGRELGKVTQRIRAAYEELIATDV